MLPAVATMGAMLVTFAVLAMALAFTGLSLGSRIGPCCTFEPLSETATWLLTFGMIIGRLEILLFVLPFTRAFWRA